MSGDVVNLRRARKARARSAEADAAATNRLRFGKSKAQRSLETAIDARERRLFEGHRRDGAESASLSPDGAKDLPDGD